LSTILVIRLLISSLYFVDDLFWSRIHWNICSG